MKKVVIALLIIANIFMVFPVFAEEVTILASGQCGENITWTVDSNYHLKVTGSGDMYGYSSTPWYDQSQYLFYYSVVETVEISEGITGIGKNAFNNCDKLTEVVLPKTVTQIADYAFAECDNLEKVTFSDNVEAIGNSAFYNSTKLATVTMPSKLLYLGEYAFSYCKMLKTVKIPESLTAIGNGAFRNSGIESVTFNDNVTTIGSGAFEKTKITELTLPKNLTVIENNAFADTKITSVVIPGNVKKIGDYAFGGCYELENITLPDGISSLGGSVFDYTKYAQNTENYENGMLYLSGYLLGYDGEMPKEVTVKDGTKAFASGFFSYQSELERVNLPDSITQIGDYTFSGCTALAEVNIPSNVKKIGEYAFEGCSTLSDITIPDSVTFMGDYVFSRSGVENVTLGSGLTSISVGCFQYCEKIQNIEIPKNIIIIGESAFENCTSLLKVVLNEGTECIKQNAFSNCTSLNEINYPDSLNVIETGVLENTAIMGEESNYTDNAFYLGKHLVALLDYSAKGEFTVKEGTKTIAGAALKMAKYSTVNLPDSLKFISENGFNNSAVTSIVIPENVEYIGAYAFSNCLNLANVNLPKKLEYMGEGCFHNCYQRLTSVNIPGSLKVIPKRAFYKCRALLNVTFNEGTEIIGEEAFYQCDKIIKAIFPTTLKRIESAAFNRGSIDVYYVPKNIEYIADGSLYSTCDLYGFTGTVAEKYASNSSGTNFIPCGDATTKTCSSVKATNDKIILNITSEASEDKYVNAALYTKDGMLLDCAVNVKEELIFENYPEAAYAKIFTWDSMGNMVYEGTAETAYIHR